MIGQNESWFLYNRSSIMGNAVNASGVYALFTPQAWIYFGESGDIGARLLEHLNGDNPCITRNAPTGFQYALYPANQRVARQNQMIVDFGPICNQKLG